MNSSDKEKQLGSLLIDKIAVSLLLPSDEPECAGSIDLQP